MLISTIEKACGSFNPLAHLFWPLGGIGDTPKSEADLP